jgi:hypothetical protein
MNLLGYKQKMILVLYAKDDEGKSVRSDALSIHPCEEAIGVEIDTCQDPIGQHIMNDNLSLELCEARLASLSAEFQGLLKRLLDKSLPVPGSYAMNLMGYKQKMILVLYAKDDDGKSVRSDALSIHPCVEVIGVEIDTCQDPIRQQIMNDNLSLEPCETRFGRSDCKKWPILMYTARPDSPELVRGRTSQESWSTNAFGTLPMTYMEGEIVDSKSLLLLKKYGLHGGRDHRRRLHTVARKGSTYFTWRRNLSQSRFPHGASCRPFTLLQVKAGLCLCFWMVHKTVQAPLENGTAIWTFTVVKLYLDLTHWRTLRKISASSEWSSTVLAASGTPSASLSADGAWCYHRIKVAPQLGMSTQRPLTGQLDQLQTRPQIPCGFAKGDNRNLF